MSEFDFIDLRPLTDLDPALGLADDAAGPGASDVVWLTRWRGPHFIGDEPADLAFKLLAVNASDLVAMNARPTHALLNLSLPGALRRHVAGRVHRRSG